MSSVQKALDTQIKNIQAKTGKTLDQLAAIVKASGMTKHGEIRDLLKRELGLGHGDANTLVHTILKSDGEGAAKATGASTGDVLAEIYAGPKAALRPIHEKLISAMGKFGEFEIAPKKGYVSLRRNRQFAMIGPATKTQVELGLNMKGVAGTGRLVAQAPGGMCQYKVRLSQEIEVDAEVIQWMGTAYDSAG